MGLSWLFVADYLISGQEIRGKEEQRIKDITERALLQTDLCIPRKHDRLLLIRILIPYYPNNVIVKPKRMKYFCKRLKGYLLGLYL